MAESSRYALFKPDVLETVGYAYGRATSTERQGVYDVERLASGRWVDLGAFATQRGAAEVERRGVTEEEALSGIGTYVGSALCVARVPPGKPKVWDYGVVAGYTWCDRTITGTLQITFIEGTSNVAFVKEELQDLAIATYALRPCQMRGTADIMPAEMRSLHAAAHGHFNGVGEPARRSSTTVLKKLTMNLIDESQAVPVYNLDKTRIEFLKIEHILNYVFYQEGRRRAPQGMDVAASLFAPDAEPGRADDHGPHGHNSTDAERMYQHYDSDDDLAPAEPSRGDRPSERAKRGRDELPVEAASNQRDSRLTALRRRLEDDPEMVRDIVQLIAFRQSNLSNGSASSLVNTATTEPKSQFRSSRQQGIVHGAMTNELVDAARRFLLLLRKTKSMQGPEAVPELVAWIDDRFESFRIAGRSVGPTWLKVTEEALFCRCKTIAGRLFGPSWLTVTTEASFCRRKRITGRQTGAWWLKVTEKTLFGRCQPQDNTPLG
ncbi:hypothetical protein PF006_g5270 [Phytophthora fragariae]|uniref:Uncharacterized protein n=1 Tax=Phytophthora fragariae TaxID=53985 RepID=A0A6A3UIG4_9STRA|nr:hypothetical protein PF006_g5270 [Phytophthora fragariae]